jgi:hypothetical protein
MRCFSLMKAESLLYFDYHELSFLNVTVNLFTTKLIHFYKTIGKERGTSYQKMERSPDERAHIYTWKLN